MVFNKIKNKLSSIFGIQENLKLKTEGNSKKFKKFFQEETLLCPRCKKTMDKLQKEQVVLDVCKTCGGMWLDKGEVEKLYKYNAHLLKSTKK